MCWSRTERRKFEWKKQVITAIQRVPELVESLFHWVYICIRVTQIVEPNPIKRFKGLRKKPKPDQGQEDYDSGSDSDSNSKSVVIDENRLCEIGEETLTVMAGLFFLSEYHFTANPAPESYSQVLLSIFCTVISDAGIRSVAHDSLLNYCQRFIANCVRQMFMTAYPGSHGPLGSLGSQSGFSSFVAGIVDSVLTGKCQS